MSTLPQQVDMIKRLAQAAHAAGALVVSDIGSQSQWLYSTGDHPAHLYLSGPMGAAPSVGLGVALARPDVPVLVIVGDGALGMNMSSLASIAHRAPKNLTVALMDNAMYELTGREQTPTAETDWPALAKSTGFAQVNTIDGQAELALRATGGLTFWYAKVAASHQKAPPFPLQPEAIHQRFAEHVKNR